MNNEAIIFGALTILVLSFVSYTLLKWLGRGIQKAKSSSVSRRIQTTASSVLEKTSDAVSQAAKVGASFAKRVTQKDPNSRYDALLKLKQLLDARAITDEEYATEKQKILNPD